MRKLLLYEITYNITLGLSHVTCGGIQQRCRIFIQSYDD